MNDLVKYVVLMVLRMFFRFIPLGVKDNYIMFCTSSGDGYYCNPKYIYEYIHKEYNKKYVYIWAFKHPERYRVLLDSNTIICKYRSIKYYYYRLVSKFYITNSIESTEYVEKRNQYKIQTWHGGGAYKIVGLDEKGVSCLYKKRVALNVNDTDFFLSSSKKLSDFMIRGSFRFKNEIINTGMPRNDIFFNNQHISIRKKVRKKLDVENKYVVLYAPTWRYDRNRDFHEIDFNRIKYAIKEKFGKETAVLVRMHIHSRQKFDNNVLDVRDYPDMQELLCAADMLITDYSSCMWDFSLSDKPCLLFATDVKRYKDERDFYIPITDWPFPLATNNDELFTIIINFNMKEYLRNVKKHYSDLGSYEKGIACKMTCDIIKNISKQ